MPRSSIALMLVIHLLGRASPRPQEGAALEDGGHTRTYSTRPDDGHSERHPHDPLRWVWIDDASLALEWPSRFSLSINGAVTAYRLSLTHSQHQQPFISTTMYHVKNLRHQFEGLTSNMTYEGRLLALVGKHHWPYNLLNFTISSPALLTGLSLGQRASYGRRPSTTADLDSISISVRIRWSPTPFRTGGFPPRFSEEDGPPEAAVKPIGYRLRVWDRKRLIWQVTTTVYARDNGCEAAVRGLTLDATYKVTLEALLGEDQPGTSLSFSMDAGALHVAGGGLTTDGVSECYSGLQVRCPNSERCVSPYWICDGAPDCPDGEDEVGCDKTPCDGFRCWDDTCIARAWRCDGQRDCQDGDDEYACPQCGPEELSCPKGGGCLSRNSTCDGVHHCPDGWDESGAVCGSRSCGPSELRCLEGGRCVDHQRLCDGVPDCPTSEDEDSTFCAAFRSVKDIAPTTSTSTGNEDSVQCEKRNSAEEVNCTQEEFRCDSGECIRRLYLCNGVDDCKNGEDERPSTCTLSPADVTKDHSRTLNSEENVEDSDEYTETKEGDLENEDMDEAALCQDGRLRCDKEPVCDKDQQGDCISPSQNSSSGSPSQNSTDIELDGVNITRGINNSLKVDIPQASGNRTRFATEDTNQSLDYSNSLENEIQVFEISTLHSGMTIDNNTLELLEENGVSNPNMTQEKDGISNVTLESEKDANTVSQTQSTTPFDGVDVFVEVVVEESFYPNSSETEIDTQSVEDYDGIREPNGTEPLDTNQLFIYHNLTNVTTTDNTTSVVDAPDDFDFNATMPNLTTDGTISDISSDYDSSPEEDEDYDVSEETITSTSPVFAASESNDTEKIYTESTHLENETVISTEVEDLDEFSSTVTLSPTDEMVITGHLPVTDTPSDDKTTVTPTPFDSVGSNVSPASYTPQAEQTPEAFTETETRSVTAAEDGTTTVVPSDDAGDDSDVGTWATTTTAATLSEETPHATDNVLHTTTTTFPSLPYNEDSTTETSTEDITTDTAQTPTEGEEEHSNSTTEKPSRGTGRSTLEGAESKTTTSSFTTESNNWKEMSINQKNLTILIAIHSEMNESKIPEYVIQGMDGRPYQYEIVSIVKEDGLAQEDQEMDQTSNMLRGVAGAEEEEEEADGSHGYLQGNISSGQRCSLSLISLILVLFLHKL